eukprot:CAMPEP_0176341258 /NCGR_PEP_ID=MMETSP0126-20121128/2230_1 /TAXON_ID=141414 ORGANISM="Strombidinopsis acuminatum, Strain SPMC142" /NCGR_SAMPLE_ID=MMETSP0126 /ASSEMBLY_ACC=CAM_ASM_000229 /LENGTH=52 /DNA_ID=CAMNT_0017685959 /DNA_START=73 /DNA_END=231 /DNA_ORIENTATION=+
MTEANLKLLDKNLGQIVQKHREVSYQTAPVTKRQSSNNFNAAEDAYSVHSRS